MERSFHCLRVAWCTSTSVGLEPFTCALALVLWHQHVPNPVYGRSLSISWSFVGELLDMWQNDRAHHQQSKWMARISIEVRIRLDMLFSRGPTQQDDRYTISWWSQAASDTQSWCFFCSIFRGFDTLDLQLLQLSNHHLAKEHSPLDHVLISKAWRCLRLARLV
jgi:hypothetical protein